MDVLTTVDYYLPGFKSGGPLRSLANMVDRLDGRHRFLILSRDRDEGDRSAYPGVTPGAWTSVGSAQVMYLSPDRRSLRSLRSILSTTRHDVLYCNSVFSPVFTIGPLLLRRLGLVPRVPVVVAPRGECSADAHNIKWLKKSAFLAVARVIGLYRDVLWQATSPHEEAQIRRVFGKSARVFVASDLPSVRWGDEGSRGRRPKVPGSLRVVFVSRVARMKNLDFAISLLEGLGGEVEFDIYGPIDDREYWVQCQETIRRVSRSVRVQHHGAIPHESVGRVLREHDLFLLPTLGENFGHAILEALRSGCPVLISDRTPWRGLEAAGVGWDVPLEEPGRFRDVLLRCIEMDEATRETWSRRAREFGLAWAGDDAMVQRSAELFEFAARLALRS